jgi:hypothetical protein
MYKKLLLLNIFVLVLCLGGKAGAWQAIDNYEYNLSFEYDINGVQIRCKPVTGNMTTVLAWYDNNVPNAVPEIDCANSLGTEGCVCKNDYATDGMMKLTMGQWGTDMNMLCWQTLDPAVNPNATIKKDYEYIVYYDTFKWQNPDLLIYLYYGDIPDNNSEVMDVNTIVIGDPGASTVWKTFSVGFKAITPGAPYIGKPLGIRFYQRGQGWYWIDRIRVLYRPLTKAFDPTPPDGGEDVARSPLLKWWPGMYAQTTNEHEVYFGTSFNDVNNATTTDTTGIYRGLRDVNSYQVPETLDLAKVCYWRVDEINLPTRWRGDVWTFTVTGYAKNPIPADGAVDVPIDQVLSWTAGTSATSHDVYLGTDQTAVENATTSDTTGIYKQSGASTSYTAPAGLPARKTLYWRIDEHASAPPYYLKGEVWTFDVSNFILIDNFEDYANSTALTAVWKDYYTQGAPRTQAYVYLDTATVYDANKAMKYFYNNNITPRYAEARATCADLGVGANWTLGGMEALTLYFHGGTTNVKTRMYVALTDSANRTGTVVLDDPNDLTQAWKDYQEWNIELQRFVDANSINLSGISKMTIGFGNKSSPQSATGTVYFDQIRLYAPRCVLEENASGGDYDYWDEDCTVNYSDVNKLSDNWLLSAIGNVSTSAPPDANKLRHYPMNDTAAKAAVDDISSYNMDGTLYDSLDSKGLPKEGKASTHTTPGKIGTALTFDGVDDFVELPSLTVTTNKITFTAWGARTVVTDAFAGILYACGPNVVSPNITIGFGLGAERENWGQNYMLWNMWDGNDWMFDSGLIMPGDDQWVFMAMTIAPSVTTLYMYDGVELRAARNFTTNPMKNFTGSKLRIGDQIQFADRMWQGKLDDVRVYNYTLTPGQILYLARLGVAGSQNIAFPPWRPNGNADGVIDLRDFAVLGENWLQEALWP